MLKMKSLVIAWNFHYFGSTNSIVCFYLHSHSKLEMFGTRTGLELVFSVAIHLEISDALLSG